MSWELRLWAWWPQEGGRVTLWFRNSGWLGRTVTRCLQWHMWLLLADAANSPRGLREASLRQQIVILLSVGWCILLPLLFSLNVSLEIFLSYLYRREKYATEFGEDGLYACCSLKAELVLQTRFRFKGKLGVRNSSLFKKIPFIPATLMQGCFNGARGPWHASVFPSICTLTYIALVQVHTDWQNWAILSNLGLESLDFFQR